MKKINIRKHYSTLIFSFLLIGVFVVLGIIKPVQALFWTLNDGDGMEWNNSNFLNQDFWDSNPSDNDIIRALFGSGDEGSIYTSNRDESCVISNINVSHIANINGLEALENTIYVLSGDNEDISSTIQISYDCIAIVSSNSTGTMLNSTTSSVHNMIDIDNKSSKIIIDNIKLNGNTYAQNGISIDTDNVSINNVDTANNNIGIIAGYNEITYKNLLLNHVNSYNNFIGIKIGNTEKVIVNNLKAYNNEQHGLQAENSSYISINNSQVFKNGNRGIYIEEETGIVLNNIQTYNNTLGVVINYSHDIALNNLLSYRNAYYGDRDKGLSIGNSDNVCRAGDNVYDYHEITEDDWTECEIDLGRENYQNPGCYDGSNNTSMFCYDTAWDYFTNAINENGNFLYPWNGSVITKSYYSIYSSYLYWDEVYQLMNTVGYSYGSGILTQIEPVKYNENDEIIYWTGGTYDENNYIGSHTKKTSGSLTGIYLLTGQTPTWGVVTTGPFVMSINDTNEGIIDYFNLFGHLENYITGTSINTGAEIYLSTGAGLKTMIPQVWGDQYFATHREETTYYSCGYWSESREECDLGVSKWGISQNGPDKACNEICELNIPECSVSLQPDTMVAGEETTVTGTIEVNYDRVSLDSINITGLVLSLGNTGQTGYSSSLPITIDTGGDYNVIVTVSNPLSGDVSATCSTRLYVLAPDIYIQKSITPETDIVVNWTEVTYTIDYGNSGDSTGYNVEIIEQIPTSFTGNWSNIGTLENSTLTVEIGELGPGETGQIILTGTINSSGEFVNTAQISGSNFDTLESTVTGFAANSICGNNHQEPSEECDGEDGCNSECELITPTCSIDADSPIYSGQNSTITGTTSQSWVVFSGINFGLPNQRYSILDTGTYITGHTYYSGGNYTVSMTVVNPLSGDFQSSCTGEIDVEYCGDGETNGNEECDEGPVYLPEPGMDCDEAPDITIGEFKIQACNLGADVVGTGEDSYGRYFQRGNNFGFWNGIEGQTDEAGNEDISTSTEQVDATAYGPGNYYKSNVFIVGNPDWSSNQNNNLRGGSDSDGPDTIPTGTDAEDRQGPCPDGYHVPSQGEWNQLLIAWAVENGIDLNDNEGYKSFNNVAGVRKFIDDLLIPSAGSRYYDSSATVNGLGEKGYYWPSSPAGSNGSHLLYFGSPVGGLGTDYSFSRAIGLSLRCFQNPHTTIESEENACSNECTWNIPSCELSASPLTGFAPFQTDFTISNVNTDWMSFDYLDFGDEYTESNLNTGNLIYNHTYNQTGNFTTTLIVSNSSNPSITGSCDVDIESIQYEYCGDNITQAPNSNGENEQCDGEDRCDSSCQLITPTCSIDATSPIYSGQNSTITGTTSQSWVVFSGINFGLPNQRYSILDTGNYITGHEYSSGGNYTVSMTVKNPLSGDFQSSCTGEVEVEYCGDGETKEGFEQCDNGNQNGVECNPEYGSNCNYCSSSCETVILTGEYCGDGITQTNNGEQCDGQEWCNSECKVATPFCSLEIPPTAQAGEIFTITGTVSADWIAWKELRRHNIEGGIRDRFFLNTIYNFNDITGIISTGINYSINTGGLHGISLRVMNPVSYGTQETRIGESYYEMPMYKVYTCTGEITILSPDVYINKSISGNLDNINIGEEITYIIEYGNLGEGIATNSKIIEELPSSFTGDRSDIGEFENGSLIINLNNINPNQSGTILISGYFNEFGEFTNLAIMSGNNFETINDSTTISVLGCGDGIPQEGESCDGQDGCSESCELITPTCSIDADSPIYSGQNSTITGTTSQSWAVFSGINFGLPNQRYSILDTGNYTTGHTYYSGGTFTVSMAVKNPLSGDFQSSCTWEIEVEYCGDDKTNGNEQCDDGNENGIVCSPEYGDSCDYCSSSCEIVTLTGDDCGDEEINGDEECDGEDWCNNECELITPTCSLDMPSTVQFGDSFIITGHTDNWVAWGELNIGDSSVAWDELDLYYDFGGITGMNTTGVLYTTNNTGQFNVVLRVYHNISNDGIIGRACTGSFNVVQHGVYINKYISGSLDNINTGEYITYIIEYGNNGDGTGYNINISDTLPQYFTGFSTSTGDIEDGILTVNIGELGPEETGSILINGYFTEFGIGIENIATLSGDDISIEDEVEIDIIGCGDGEIQEGEDCDLGENNGTGSACSNKCERNTPSCNINANSSTYSGQNVNIIGTTEQDWAVFSGINFGLPNITHSIRETGTYNTGHEYYSGGNYNISMTVVNPFNVNSHNVCTKTINIKYCGNGTKDEIHGVLCKKPPCDGEEREDCDLGENNGPNSACSNQCTWNIPSCELSASPLSGFVPFETTFTVSDVDTSWMNFDYLDFGDGNYEYNLNTGTLEYANTYLNGGDFTVMLTVSNSLSPGITNSCEVSVSSMQEDGNCGDGEIQEGEDCDLGDDNGAGSACSSECTLNIPSCEVQINESRTSTSFVASGGIFAAYSGGINSIRGISEQNWAVFSGINFGLPDITHSIRETGTYNTGHGYYSGGNYIVSMIIVNPLSGDISSICTGSISIGYCGDGIRDDSNENNAHRQTNEAQLKEDHSMGSGGIIKPHFPDYYGLNMFGEEHEQISNPADTNQAEAESNHQAGTYIHIEDCDLGDANSEDSACTSYCTFNSPACSIVPYQSTITVGTEAGFTSVLNGSWVSLSGVKFGDGNYHSFGGISGRNYMEYSHVYDQTGWYIQTFYVYNHLVGQIEMCNAVVQVVDETETTPPENNEYYPNIYINKSILPNNNIDTNTLITYVIEYGNSGNGTGYNMNLRDIIPDNFTGNWNHIGSWDGNRLMLLSGTLSPGRTGHLILTGYFTSGGHTTNHAVITTSNAGTKTGSVSANIQGNICGNGFVEVGEYCDDGPLNGTNGHCSNNCSRFLKEEPIDTGHSSAGIICRYSDENYYDNGPFTDTLGHRGFEYIEIMRKSCLHRGRATRQGLWKHYPDSSITKAEVLKTLVKIVGIAKEDFDIITEDIPYNGIQIFADVPGNHWFSRYTNYAYNFGITNELYSISNQQKYLKPDSTISRYEIIKKIMETYKKIVSNKKIDISTKSNLTDISKANPYYQYVREAEVLGIINGEKQKDGNYKFLGDRPLTRAEFAKIVSIPFGELLFLD